MADNPLVNSEQIRNEFNDIRHDAVIPLLSAAVAINNGHDVPDEVKAKLQDLAERVFAAQVAFANLNGGDVPARPAYLDPVEL